MRRHHLHVLLLPVAVLTLRGLAVLLRVPLRSRVEDPRVWDRLLGWLPPELYDEYVVGTGWGLVSGCIVQLTFFLLLGLVMACIGSLASRAHCRRGIAAVHFVVVLIASLVVLYERIPQLRLLKDQHPIETKSWVVGELMGSSPPTWAFASDAVQTDEYGVAWAIVRGDDQIHGCWVDIGVSRCRTFASSMDSARDYQCRVWGGDRIWLSAKRYSDRTELCVQKYDRRGTIAIQGTCRMPADTNVLLRLMVSVSWLARLSQLDQRNDFLGVGESVVFGDFWRFGGRNGL